MATRKMADSFTALVGVCLVMAWTLVANAQGIATFEGLSFPDGQDFYNGEDGAGQFLSNGALFENQFADFGTFTAWEGFAYSRVTDNTTPGFGNQYSAFPGGGAEGSPNYGIGFSGADAGSGDVVPTVRLPDFAQPLSMQVTNTTYAALTIRDGSPFNDPFGGTSGDDPDFFRLTVRAIDAAGETVAQLDPVYLADYRFEDNTDDFILDEWVEIDLRPLRNRNAVGLELRLTTSDIGEFGPNTPMYVAIDEVTFDVQHPGDFNGDLVVDAADYTVWRDTLGQSISLSGSAADGDFSGAVDLGDYAIWKQHFGTSYAITALGAAAVPLPVPIPEPGTMALALLASFAFVVGCRLRS